MGNKEKILEYRRRLDRTLGSHDLSNEEAIKFRLKNELLHSSPSENQEYVENIVDKSGKEVLNCVDMLRSVGDGDWKLKQDTDEYRVMYREGPQGTPLHSLLVEGWAYGCFWLHFWLQVYVLDGKWPQFKFPTFKIIESKFVLNVRIGEQIALVRILIFFVNHLEERMKCTWPLSAREVVVHCFVVEFLEDNLLIFVLNSVTDTESVDRSTHEFTYDGIPEIKDIILAGLVGGLALQKVTSNRSYIRHLIGSGFKLYKRSDIDSRGLEDTLYVQIREGLNQENRLKMDSEPDIPTGLPADATVRAKTSLGDHLLIQSKQEDMAVSASCLTAEQIGKEKKVFISPEVEHALGILNNVISMVRGSGINSQTWSGLGSTNQEMVSSRTTPQDHFGGAICVKALKTDKKDANLSKDYSEVTVKVNGIHEGSNINGGEKSRQRKNHRLCCFRSAAYQ
ncbi:hypothetical protein MKW92_021311 [Papaver armeniacum]|nr:hypothetical protein MKW92_021311 [Papaver armeniacum]